MVLVTTCHVRSGERPLIAGWRETENEDDDDNVNCAVLLLCGNEVKAKETYLSRSTTTFIVFIPIEY